MREKKYNGDYSIILYKDNNNKMINNSTFLFQPSAPGERYDESNEMIVESRSTGLLVLRGNSIAAIHLMAD